MDENEEYGVVVRGCLAQSGMPVGFCADGTIIVKLHLPQCEKDQATKLLDFTERPLFITFAVDDTDEGQLIKRHGGARPGAGRPRKDAE